MDCARLCDFGLACAGFQLVEIGTQGTELCRSRVDCLLKRRGVEAAENVACFDRVAFIDGQSVYAPADTKAERYLPDIDIAVEHRGRALLGPSET
ncbi:hypothetical protein D3C87_1749230 [compost metagenome]